MQRFAILFALLLCLCTSLRAQEPTGTRFALTARFIPNTGAPVTATIPEVLAGNVTVPLQVGPATMWLLTVGLTKREGEITVSISDTTILRPPAGAGSTTPVVIAQATYPYTFGRTVTVLQTGTYRVELLLTPM